MVSAQDSGLSGPGSSPGLPVSTLRGINSYRRTYVEGEGGLVMDYIPSWGVNILVELHAILTKLSARNCRLLGS